MLIQLVWIIFLLSAFLPALRQRRLRLERFRRLQQLSRERGSRVITLIHRQESISFLGLPVRRFIDIDDSEEVLRAIRLTPDDVPIDIVLHTPGGLVLASEQIALAIKGHPAPVRVLVPHYAMSGGTMLALAADEIWMDENAVLGPVDPQLGRYPAVSLLRVLEQKDINEIDDETLILADIARKAVHQVSGLVYRLLEDKMDEDKARQVAEALTEGRWTHDFPITCDILRDLGLSIRCQLPASVYELMRLYEQPATRRPSVQYVPIPSGPRRDQRGTDENR